MRTKSNERRIGQLLLTLLLTLVVGVSAARADVINANPSAADIAAAVEAADTDIKPVWTNDATYPWQIWEDANGQTLMSSNVGNGTTSTISFKYTSTDPVYLRFDVYHVQGNSSSYPHYTLQWNVDGEEHGKYQNVNSAAWEWVKEYIPAGTHTITISYSCDNDKESHTQLKNLAIYKDTWATDPSQAKKRRILTENSLPVTFINDSENPWKLQDSDIVATINKDSSSTLIANVTLDRPAIMDYELRITENYSNSWHRNTIVDFIVDNKIYFSYCPEKYEYTSQPFALSEGKHEIKWILSHNCSQCNESTTNHAEIRNISLRSPEVKVDLTTGIPIGNQVLEQVDYLKDVEFITVKGKLSDADYSTIQTQMPNLKIADFSEAIYSSHKSLPSPIRFVKIGKDVTRIADDAFKDRSNIFFIDIPDAVEIIGNRAFQFSTVQYIQFSTDSKLTSIWDDAFYSARLKEINIPQTVSWVGNYAFQNTLLSKLEFPTGISTINKYVAYNCNSLTEVIIPEGVTYIDDNAFRSCYNLRSIDLPSTLTGIGTRAFYDCYLGEVMLPDHLIGLGDECFSRSGSNSQDMKYVRLSPSINSYSSQYAPFAHCAGITTIVCPVATPPSVSKDPFPNVSGNTKLIVPDFAVADYKLHEYWDKFYPIEAGEEASNLPYWCLRDHLTLYEGKRMQGKPELDIWADWGALTLKGDSPREYSKVSLFTKPRYMNNHNYSETNNDRYRNAVRTESGSIVNNECNSVSVDETVVNFNMDNRRWHFFTPVADVDFSQIGFNPDYSYSIKRFDGAKRASAENNGKDDCWVKETSSLKAGQGYIIQTNVEHSITFPGSDANGEHLFSTKEVTVPLEAHDNENNALRDWNFVGNPYPCFYDIYCMEVEAPITVWNGSTYEAKSLIDDDYILFPMEAFFVQKPKTPVTTDGNLTFRLPGKQVNLTVNHRDKAQSRLNPLRRLFEVGIGTDSIVDRTRIVFNPEAESAYESSRDASKFMSLDRTVPQIYTIIPETRCAINERPEEDGIVRVGVYTPAAGEVYTIAPVRTAGTIYLHDAATGAEVDITEEPYPFVSAKSGEDDDRFTLRLVPSAPTGTETVSLEKESVTAGAGFIQVNAGEETPVEIYDLQGRVAGSWNGNGRIEVQQGVYMVRLGGETVKVIVK